MENGDNGVIINRNKPIHKGARSAEYSRWHERRVPTGSSGGGRIERQSETRHRSSEHKTMEFRL